MLISLGNIDQLVRLARHSEHSTTYQAVNRRTFTAEDQFSSRSVHLGVVAKEASLVQALYTTPRFLSCQYHSTNTPYAIYIQSNEIHIVYLVGLYIQGVSRL